MRMQSKEYSTGSVHKELESHIYKLYKNKDTSNGDSTLPRRFPLGYTTNDEHCN